MIDRLRLLPDLQKILNKLESDLLERTDSTDVPEIGKTLRSEYDRARQAERTAQSYEEWKSDTVTQIAAAWVLSCVFVRFLEDNRLIDPPKIAGLAERLQRARDEHELYFRSHPSETDRDYLLSIFNDLAKLPGTKDVFGEHNPIRELSKWLSGDAAGELLQFFQKIEANTGTLVHNFTDSTWDTRFLGDLYQDLSEAARKKYALLQTPEFVEEFILDRTLEPALDEFGLDAAALKDTEGRETTRRGFRMMDPACGSGHFVLGAFHRILNRWLKQEPGAKIRDLVQRTLDSIHGVDLNPYAVAIARFRLLLASMRACGITRLADAPAFHFNFACGDSLLHGVLTQGFLGDWSPIAHHFHSEDIDTLRRLLMPGQYHAVVANPPYITPKDRALNAAYRERYSTCHKKYSLAVPFMERIFQLALDGGFTGQITANSFMKREFGKKLIEEFFPKVDLTHVIDTSGAYIPGHATPTVILFGRRRAPIANTLRTVLGIRGEPTTPDDPAKGRVWSAIIAQIDQPNSQSEFLSASDSARDQFHRHPWSVGGGGASELKELLDTHGEQTIGNMAQSVGITCFPMEDGIFLLDPEAALRRGLPHQHIRTMVVGDAIRDWVLGECEVAVFPYDDDFNPIPVDLDNPCLRYLWIARSVLSRSLMFGGKTKVETGLRWYEFGRLTADKLRTPLSIAFPLIATHNHFLLDRGRKVFKNSVYVIKLQQHFEENDYVGLLGLLNSSLACFWLKQVCYPKGTSTGDISKEKGKPEANRFDFGSKAILSFPIPPKALEVDGSLVSITRRIESVASELVMAEPHEVLRRWALSPKESNLTRLMETARADHYRHSQLIFLLQEELDWEVYRLFGITDTERIPLEAELEGIAQGNRPFLWPEGKAPDELLESHRAIYLQRRHQIEHDPLVSLIENEMYKRPWLGRQGVYGSESSTYEDRQKIALSHFLLQRLEGYFDLDGRMSREDRVTSPLDIALVSVATLSDMARRDAEFMQVGELYRQDAAFDIHRLVSDLIEADAVPLLPVLTYKEVGLRKRIEWLRTWELQRREDKIDNCSRLPKDDSDYLTVEQTLDLKRREIGNISVPPKYTSPDFLESQYWRLRGKLDVPKERWISFPHCEGPDGTLLIAWAGYDHLQLAKAISTYYVDVQERFGGRDDPRLVPLLACVIELLPWIKQWHNDSNPDFNGMHMGDYFEGFVQEEARQMGKTIAEIKAWQPPHRARSKRTGG